MAKAKFDIKSEASRPLYAGVGVTDLAVEYVRDAVSDMQKKLTDVQKDMQSRVDDLKPHALRERVDARVSDLQADAKSLPGRVNDTYTDLAKRGETLVERIRKQQSTKDTVSSAKTTSTKAKTTKTQATKAAKSTAKKASTSAKKAASAPKSSAKATATAAKQTASEATKAAGDAAQKVGD